MRLAGTEDGLVGVVAGELPVGVVGGVVVVGAGLVGGAGVELLVAGFGELLEHAPLSIPAVANRASPNPPLVRLRLVLRLPTSTMGSTMAQWQPEMPAEWAVSVCRYGDNDR